MRLRKQWKKACVFAAAVLSIMSFGMGNVLSYGAVGEAGGPGKVHGQIYLYGESHGSEEIMKKELEIWNDHYHKDGMRHLFVELPSYTVEYLNLWMQAENDDILNAVYEDWKGTLSYNDYIRDFYRTIKVQCPETVFHGTDVGHQYETTGVRYLTEMEQGGLKDSEKYKTAQNVIEQGKYYYANNAAVYRENTMVQNFTYEFNKLEGESIMGIYGSAHIGLESMDYSTGTVPCMAAQLKGIYGDIVHSEDLTWIKADVAPVRTDKMTVNGKEYQATYFGKEDLAGFKNFAYREFWRLENAYDDMKDKPKTGDALPYGNYPTLVENGQVFVVDYTMTDGSVTRQYYRSDGNRWDGRPTTEEFVVE